MNIRSLWAIAALTLACSACAGGLAGLADATPTAAIAAEGSTETKCRLDSDGLDRKAPTPAVATAKVVAHDSAMVKVGQVRALFDRTLRARATDEQKDRLSRARDEVDDACQRYRDRLVGFAETG